MRVERRARFRIILDINNASCLLRLGESTFAGGRPGFGKRCARIITQLCDADNTAVYQNAESGAQRRFDIAHDLFRVKLRAGQDVNFRESARLIRNCASGNYTSQRG